MGRYLNIGLIQPELSEDGALVYERIEREVEYLMAGYPKPELIVGPECIQALTPEKIPGRQTDYFASIAKKHGIYFIPGSIIEKSEDLPDGICYNSAPIFNPKGELVDVYRKMAPWRPSEDTTAPGRRYVVFDIPEKNTKIGVQICYDINFPEISRNETLMGAEVLVKLTLDPTQLYDLNKYVHIVRALENQAFLVSTQSVGTFLGSTLYGNSMIVNPEGQIMWQGGEVPTSCCTVIDLDMVTNARNYGTIFNDHYIQHLRDFNFHMPFSNDVSKAPLYQNIRKTPLNVLENDADLAMIGIGTIGKRFDLDETIDIEQLNKNMDKYLEKKGF